MKKSDLENGMILETRKGIKYILIKDFTQKTSINGKCYDILMNIDFGSFGTLEEYNEDLKSKFYELDIIKVYCLKYGCSNKDELEILWQR